MRLLENKVAVITGGSGGIGSATARLFLEEGAKVMLVGRTENKLKDFVGELNSNNVKYSVADVSKSVEVERYVQSTIDAFGKIDIFFNNAGVEGAIARTVKYDEDEFDKVINVNLKGVWLGCKYVIPHMNDGGSVIITSSVAGLKGFDGLSAYVASKHGVVGLMRTAAVEYASRKIRVNTIHPGPINNRMMRAIEKSASPDNPEAVKAEFESQILLKRYGESTEIGQLVLFLASEQSSYTTGSTFVADGGMLQG